MMISTERWQVAQQGERDFWTAEDRTRLCAQLNALYVRELQITPEAVMGRAVLDLGGGPFPLGVVLAIPLSRLTVVDPLSTMFQPTDPPHVVRVTLPAEDYTGPMADEVWGYNVLQHVIDPGAVLAKARLHATQRVRWFDWVDTPIASHHPHSIKADWLVRDFADAGWTIVQDTRGSVMVPHLQRYVALIAERPT